MLAKAIALFALASAIIATPIVDTRADKPDPSQVTIKGITTSGTGCPQGSVGQFLDSSRQTFTLIFDQYVASIGPDAPNVDNRKFCQINLQLHYPQGFQYSIMSTIYRGFVQLDSGVTGSQGATYYFTGQSAQVSTKSSFKGPISKDYTITDTLNIASTIWSPCGADLPINIKSQISLSSTNKAGTGLLTTDSVDGKITWVTGIQWRRC
ncbi:hypothetical protein BJ875DRAFT_373994 [Amylocarpus encephaloides]|uniref:Secreted protein n=1 Tax=Amylocarpus encephaloides TaxID=45428 RepID=A0A9P8C6D0_9HELO|nr:hypothetical protein BJ875DRAFT_373994 [Amylocarpus encephaloides]